MFHVERIEKSVEFVVKDRDDEKRRLFGWGYQAKTADGRQVQDWSGDVIDTHEAFSEFEEAHYLYMRDSREGDAGHETFGVMKVIESVVMSPEKARHMGIDDKVPSGAWLGFEFERDPAGEQAWETAKAADKLMLSMVGWAGREEL